MDYIARRGYDVYLVDVRGYEDRRVPRKWSSPPSKRAIVRTETAVRDVPRRWIHSRARRASRMIPA